MKTKQKTMFAAARAAKQTLRIIQALMLSCVITTNVNAAPMVNTYTLSEFEEWMVQNRPLVPMQRLNTTAKNNNNQQIESERVAVQAIGDAFLGYKTSWTNVLDTQFEQISICEFIDENGSINHFATYNQEGCIVKYYWCATHVTSNNSDSIYDLIENFCNVSNVPIYSSERLLSSCETELTVRGNHINIPYERFYFAFVDDMPGANWDHPCRYIFWSEDKSEFTILYKSTYPDIIEVGTNKRIILKRKTTAQQGIQSLEEIKNNVYRYADNLASNELKYSNGDAGHSYFVLISGGEKPLKNGIRFWCDTAMMYSTLTKRYRVPKSNVFVYVSDGTSTGNDANLSDEYNPVLVSSPIDLDGDGTSDIDGAATRQNVISCFSNLKGKLQSSDQLMVFITSHGGPLGNGGKNDWRCGACLFNESGTESFTDYELASWTKDINCPISFAIETCYSGGFIDDLCATENRIVSTASTHYESSYGRRGTGAWYGGITGQTSVYNCWAGPYITAFRGYIPQPLATGSGGYPWSDYATINADSDGNGIVSFSEAFYYAKNNDSAGESPQYSDNPSGIGNSTFLLKQNSALEVSITPSTKTFLYLADNGSFSVTASSSWAVSKSHSWITLKTTSGSGKGTVYYEVEENKTGEQREGTITVQCGSETATHTVRQSAEAAKLILKPTTSDVSCALDGGSFDVEANYSWTATTTASWITVNTPSGSGNGTVLYSVLENTGSQRTGTITVTSGSLTATHTVTQAAKPQIELEPGAKTFTADEGSGTIAVTSDSMWTVSKSETWIRLETTTGTGNGTIKYSVLENTGSKREGWIYVKSGSVQKSFRVTQYRRDTVTFSEESASVPYSGGSGSFTVTVLANNYYITTTASEVKWASWAWTKEQVTEGYRYTCNYTVQTAPSYEKRTVKIPIVLNETTYYFTITQGFGADTYRVSYEPGANGRGFAFYNLKTHDVPLTLSSSKFTRSGYTQKGWATIDGGAKAYDFGASYTKNEAITLYPYWEMDSGSAPTTYTIHFSPGAYGVGFNQTATKYKGVSLALPGAIYTREGYEQTGWSTVRSGTTKSYNLGGAYTTDAGAYLYPYWTEKVTESFDIGFYTPSAYKQPVCLSTTNIAYWAYAPQYVFEPGGGLVLNYCAANYSDADATLVDKYMSLWDKDYTKIESEVESYADTVPAGKGMLFPNRDLSSWLSSISPGNYLLMTYLDPYNKLNDPDDSNNSWQTWFAVKADGITLNEALDCGSLYFTDNGTTAFPQTSESVVGGSCVQFGPQPTNSANSVLYGYVTEPGTLTFKWKASGKDYKGCLIFYVGNEMETWEWAGSADWREEKVNITEADVSSGSVWVGWRLATYDADPSVLTAGWVDNVVWNPSGRKPTFTVDAAGTLTGVELNGVTDIEIPSMVNGVAVRAIGSRVFEKTAITSVSIPDTITNVADRAFLDCASLAGISIPGSVKSIGDTAFCRCHKLRSVVLEEGLEKIGNTAFYNCLGLTYVKLPSTVLDIGYAPFGHNPSLKTIDVAQGNTKFCTMDYALVDKSAMGLLQYPMGRSQNSYEVPEGIVGIAYCAFDWATNLTSVTLPKSLVGMGNIAFGYCSSLETVKFKGNAPNVGGEQIFLDVPSSCKALVSPQSSGWGVSIPGTWQGIGIEYSAALQTYAVTYKPGTYGTGVQTSEVKQYGITLPLKGAIFTRTGYLQTGWATSDGGAKAYELGASYTANAALTLYPYWTANTYSVSYDFDGGEAGVAKPASAGYGTAFRVSAPTRDGYVFMGWMVTSGLDITTARYGESSSSLSTDIDNASMLCFNGSDVDVWFINLTPQPDGKVLLTATWEPVADDSRDIGFYAPANKGWTFPVCLSSTNIEYLAYAPETEFVQGMGVYLSFCAVNWSRAGSALLQSTLLTITDESGAMFDQGEPIQLATIGAFGYWEFRNISLRRYLSGITPGRYKLTLELDPNRLLNDPDRSNNTTSIWFTVTAPTDPIPELPSDATAADVRGALAGSADERLAQYITDVSTYSVYCEWAHRAKGVDGKTVGTAAVKASDKAWFSFAIDSAKLIEREIVKDDIQIEDFAVALNGSQFDFTVGITDIEVGDAAKAERLKTVFGIEGATQLNDAAFSADNLTLEAVMPEDGKVKLTVKPAAPKTGEEPADSAFFMRAKVHVK